jgi:hypothetical protein
MHYGQARILVLLVLASAALATGAALTQQRVVPIDQSKPRALKSITFNTQAYAVGPGKIDKRAHQIVAGEDMHIVALEHFTGVGKGSWSDNGHILSTNSDNPWAKWEGAGTGMVSGKLKEGRRMVATGT